MTILEWMVIAVLEWIVIVGKGAPYIWEVDLLKLKSSTDGVWPVGLCGSLERNTAQPTNTILGRVCARM